MDVPPTIESNAQFVSQLANSAVLDIVKVLTGAILYGIYLVLLLAALSILGHREGKIKARITLISALLVMFAISSFEFWGIVHLCFRSIQIILVNNVEMPYSDKLLTFFDGFTKLISVIQVLLPLEVVIGDAIVLWRAWKLCAENRKLVYPPMFFLFVTTVCSLGYLGCYAKNDWPASNPDTCNNLQISVFSLSLATNLMGTLVVGYKVWLHRQAVGEFLGQCRQRTRAEKVLILLMESGAAYSILWIVQLIVVLSPPARTFSGKVAQQVFYTSSIQMVGMYPTFMVVLVYLQYSIWDSTGTLSTNATSPTSNSVTVYEASGGSKTTLGSTKMA
ncbi:hypothetical protein PM082_023352 [Marasmius tenuissimus]|nr:hypothetical protein PM082_023352 [Marasmius tenuissimus]